MGFTEDDAVAHAADRANRDRGACFAVYRDDAGAYYVRAFEAAPPVNMSGTDLMPMDEVRQRANAVARVICIAQFWGDDTVQVRYSGARSEWRRF